MAKKNELVKVAKELNRVLGLDPEIETKGAEANKLKEDILEAAGLIEPEDEISAKTEGIINELRQEQGQVEQETEEEGQEQEIDDGSASLRAEVGDEEEEEEEEKEEEEKKEPEQAKQAKPGSDKPKEGVIATIASLIQESGHQGITKVEILEELKNRFPDRSEKSMKNTLNVQVPNRVSKEKFPVEKLEGGKYRKKQ